MTQIGNKIIEKQDDKLLISQIREITLNNKDTVRMSAVSGDEDKELEMTIKLVEKELFKTIRKIKNLKTKAEELRGLLDSLREDTSTNTANIEVKDE